MAFLQLFFHIFHTINDLQKWYFYMLTMLSSFSQSQDSLHHSTVHVLPLTFKVVDYYRILMLQSPYFLSKLFNINCLCPRLVGYLSATYPKLTHSSYFSLFILSISSNGMRCGQCLHFLHRLTIK